VLNLALASSVAALAIASGFLILLGRRPTPGAAGRLLVVLGIAVLSALGVAASYSLLPAAVAVGIVAVALLSPSRWYAIGSLFFASLLVATAVYAAYLTRATLLLGSDPASAVLGLVLLVLEFGAMGLILASAFEMIDALCAKSPGLPASYSPDRWPVVCLQVPTYNEPPELVVETVRSLVALDYPVLRIQVIDNNTTDEALWRPVEAECADLRTGGHQVEFVHLPEWPGYKAGALNWGRTHLEPDVEIVGVVDADYVVDPGWLRTAVPYFGDPAVAFVQTPQDYREWEASAFYRACYVGFAYFFKVGMVSRARRNAIIFAGTMGLIRRSDLDAVGGWDERIITEDAEISLRVLARGARSVYLPRAFGHGIMPLTYEGLRKQRYRWAFGGIQILRAHWRTMLGRSSRLTLGQRYDYLVGSLWWFNDALTLGFTIFVAATALGAVTGRPFVVQRLTGLGLVLPTVLIVLNLLRYLWALRATTGASPALALAALRVNLSLSWVIALACVRGMVQERGVFLRTPKFAGAPAIRELRLVWVETAIVASIAPLLVLDLARAGFALVGVVLAALLVWALFIYGSAITYALGDPARAPIGDVLRSKMALELAPRFGRVVRSRSARVSLALGLVASFALIAAVASESGRSAVADLPFANVPAGPVQAAPATRAAPTAGATASPSATAIPSPTPSPTASATPTPTPAPTASPSPSPTASTVPTPTPRHTPPGSGHTPQPHPSHP
jgi:cellulose synthase/poly-beta-1,6-N-acetylglucosamine synthase-like glycosyltransferase